MKKKWIALAASFALLTGCGSDTASAKSASAASAAVSAAPAKSQNKSGESAVKKSEERIIRITSGSHVIHAKLYDNAAARSLRATFSPPGSTPSLFRPRWMVAHIVSQTVSR